MAAVGAPATADAGGWTQYRNGPTNNAHAASNGQVATGEIGTANEVRATPVIADGTMFVGNHDSGELQAFDLATGEEKWRSTAPNWIHSEMIHANGTVYVGYGNRHQIDPPSGTRGTGHSGVRALDAATGETLWDMPTEGHVMPTPVLANGALWAVTGDKHLYKIDPATGRELNREGLGHNVSMSSPAEANGVLYFGADYPLPQTFFAYDTAREDFLWQHEFPEFQMGLGDVPPAVDDGVVVTTANEAVGPGHIGSFEAGGPGERHDIVAMNAETGEILWRDTLGSGPATQNNRSGAPMIHEGRVFVGSPTTNTTYAYDLHTGQRLWDRPTGPVKAAPVAEGDDVYVSTGNGELYVLDAATGDMRGRAGLDGALAPAGPVLVDGTYLVVPSQAHKVYVLPREEIPSASWGPGEELLGAVDLTGSLSGRIG